jgi:hypothetical protein
MITTYAELVTALDGSDGYLHKTNVTAKIPDFIKIAESGINRSLRLLQQETEADLVATVSSRTMAVPTRFGSPLQFWLTTYEPRTELVFRSPVDLPVTTWNSQSDFYTVDGQTIATENPADQAYTYTLRYLAKFDLETTSTNTVLTNYPDVYVYGACLASIPWTRDVKYFDMWSGLYEKAIREAQNDTTKTRGRALLRTDFGSRGSNILRGY